MLQTIYLQNLEEFGHHEGHQFEFQVLGAWKSKKKAGAHLSVLTAA
jgi:hypothetical protein